MATTEDSTPFVIFRFDGFLNYDEESLKQFNLLYSCHIKNPHRLFDDDNMESPKSEADLITTIRSILVDELISPRAYDTEDTSCIAPLLNHAIITVSSKISDSPKCLTPNTLKHVVMQAKAKYINVIYINFNPYSLAVNKRNFLDWSMFTADNLPHQGVSGFHTPPILDTTPPDSLILLQVGQVSFFLQDFATSFIILLGITLTALLDPQVDLQEKIALQATGISHLLDTYSDGIIALLFLYQVATKRISRKDDRSGNDWFQTAKPIRMSYIGVILFAIVGTYFHFMGVDESGEEPHPFYSCFFCPAGAFILFWHCRGLIEFCNACKPTLQMKVKAHFLCLAIVPPMLCLFGCSSTVNRFLFNGWAHFYSSVALWPLLREAQKCVTSPILSFKLQILSFLFPVTWLAFLAESVIVEKFHVDVHAMVHVFSLCYVILMHSCLAAHSTISASHIQ